MLTPDVEKYIQTQFENELTPEEVVEDLVKGGWREADAKTVVRQYETRQALDHAPPTPPQEKKSKKKTQKIDFAKVGSHGDQTHDEEDDEPMSSDHSNEPPKIHQEVEGKAMSIQEQKDVSQNKKNAKAEELLSSRVDMNTSYEDLSMNMPRDDDRKNIHRNQGDNSDMYEEPLTGFSPLDMKPHRDTEGSDVSQKSQAQKVSKKDSGKKRVLITLFLVWLLVIGIVVFLYLTFVQSGSTNKNEQIPIQGEQGTPLDSNKNPQDVSLGSMCVSDINCFVKEGSSCLSPTSVEKVKVNSFFASRQKVKTFLSVIPQPEGGCLFTSEVLSVETEFTGNVAQDTRRNIQNEDKKSVGLEGACLISSNEIGGFLKKVRDGSLSDLDILSVGCIGSYYEQDSITF